MWHLAEVPFPFLLHFSFRGTSAKESIKRFGFGTKFVQWVKTLFKSGQSCVVGNGYFALERGTRQFGTLSSLKLNLQKSEACWTGASRFNTNTPTNCIGVNLVNDKIWILGTYISYNKQLADQYNFVNVITDTKNISSI